MDYIYNLSNKSAMYLANLSKELNGIFEIKFKYIRPSQHWHLYKVNCHTIFISYSNLLFYLIHLYKSLMKLKG